MDLLLEYLFRQRTLSAFRPVIDALVRDKHPRAEALRTLHVRRLPGRYDLLDGTGTPIHSWRYAVGDDNGRNQQRRAVWHGLAYYVRERLCATCPVCNFGRLLVYRDATDIRSLEVHPCQVCQARGWIYCPPDARWPGSIVRLAEAILAGQDCSFALRDALLEAGHPELAACIGQKGWRRRKPLLLALILGPREPLWPVGKRRGRRA